MSWLVFGVMLVPEFELAIISKLRTVQLKPKIKILLFNYLMYPVIRSDFDHTMR